MADKLNGLEQYREKQKAQKTEVKEEVVETETKEKVVSKKSASYKVINGIDVNPNKEYQFETIEKSSTRRHVSIGATCKMFDVEKEQPRTIRYVPTASTIFDDDLADSFKESNPYVGFYGNELTVSGDIRLVEYLLSHDDFDGNPKRIRKTPPVFTLANKEIVEAKKAEQFTKEEMALDVINKTSEEKLKPIARIVFNIMDEDFGHIKNRLKEIVREPKKKGGKSGADFILDNVDNPKLERKYIIQKGFDQGIIAINADKGSAVWGDTKSYIATIKNVKDSGRQVEELTEFSLTSKGESFFELLKSKV